MTEGKRALEIDGEGWLRWVTDDHFSTPYIAYRIGDKEAVLDGGFTADELRQIAALMRQEETP